MNTSKRTKVAKLNLQNMRDTNNNNNSTTEIMLKDKESFVSCRVNSKNQSSNLDSLESVLIEDFNIKNIEHRQFRESIDSLNNLSFIAQA